jgi:hypothetical protein
MRLTTDRQWARRAVVLLATGAFVVAGCDSGRPGPTGAGTTTEDGPAAAQTLRQAADAFLADLGEGRVTPAQLTPSFLKAIARPKGDPEAEARDYLVRFRGARFFILQESTRRNVVILRGRAESPDRKDAFSLRLVNDGGYKLDWLHRSERMGTNFGVISSPELDAAHDVVRNFLDILLGGDLRLAHALMTPEWKKKLAPPNEPDVRDGYDYSPGFLTQTTKAWRGEYVGYSLTKSDLNAAKDGATFIAELEAGGMKTQYFVKATKASGQWLIEAFDKQRPPG